MAKPSLFVDQFIWRQTPMKTALLAYWFSRLAWSTIFRILNESSGEEEWELFNGYMQIPLENRQQAESVGR